MLPPMQLSCHPHVIGQTQGLTDDADFTLVQQTDGLHQLELQIFRQNGLQTLQRQNKNYASHLSKVQNYFSITENFFHLLVIL